MGALQPIFDPYEEGRSSLLVTGRSLLDLDVDAEDRIRPLLEIFRREARARYDMVTVTYSMAGGVDWDPTRITDELDRHTIEAFLGEHHLTGIVPDQNQVIQVLRGVSTACRVPAGGRTWAENGRPIRFAFLLEFAEHLVPGTLSNGTQTDAQLVAIELAFLTSQSLALRASGNLLLFHGRDGLIDDLVARALHHIHLPQPGPAEKERFLSAALCIYTDAVLERGLTPQVIGNLAANTPNSGLEALTRASHRTGQPVSAREIAEQKARDVAHVSEGTLKVLDTHRVEGVQLYGRNIATAHAALRRYAAGLLRGDSTIPLAIVLAGPHGVGKTDLAIMVASDGGAAAYEVLSPKGGLVGATEHNARVQQQALAEWAPNVAYIDEVTEAFQLDGIAFDGDSGASRAVQAALLTALSDETRRGRSLLIASSNKPYQMSARFRSRFTFIPVLYPAEPDFPGIIVAIARSIRRDTTLTDSDPQVREAARLFYEKGANPREIRQAITGAVLDMDRLDGAVVLAAADDFIGASDMVSVAYADLWAIRLCSYRRFLPWSRDPASYPLPLHLNGIVEPRTGAVDYQALDARIEELRPHVDL